MLVELVVVIQQSPGKKKPTSFLTGPEYLAQRSGITTTAAGWRGGQVRMLPAASFYRSLRIASATRRPVMPIAAGREVYIVAAGSAEDPGAVAGSVPDPVPAPVPDTVFDPEPGAVPDPVPDVMVDTDPDVAFDPVPEAVTEVVVKFPESGCGFVPLRGAVVYAVAAPAGPAPGVLPELPAFRRLKVAVAVTSWRTPDTVTM